MIKKVIIDKFYSRINLSMTIERFILMDSEIVQNLFKIIVNEEII